MSFKDEYFLAKEYAESMYDVETEEYWIAVGAYVKGFNDGSLGFKKEIDGITIRSIAFVFGNDKREFELSNPIKIKRRYTFVSQLKEITGIRNIYAYE